MTTYLACGLRPKEQLEYNVFYSAITLFDSDIRTIGATIEISGETSIPELEDKHIRESDNAIVVYLPRYWVNGTGPSYAVSGEIEKIFTVYKERFNSSERAKMRIALFYDNSINLTEIGASQWLAGITVPFNREYICTEEGKLQLNGVVRQIYTQFYDKTSTPLLDAVISFMREHPIATFLIGFGVGTGATAGIVHLARKSQRVGKVKSGGKNVGCN